MPRINTQKIQQQKVPQRGVIAKPPDLSLYTQPDAPYPFSVCICMVVKDTIPDVQKIRTYFAKSYIVFVGSQQQQNNTLGSTYFCSAESEAKNTYLSFVVAYKHMFDIMMVIDPIFLEVPPSVSSLSCCSIDQFNTWDAIFANQSYKYYDHKSLLPPQDIKYIHPKQPRIPVSSAFGGLALYKTRYLKHHMYGNDGHVIFNTQVSNEGGSRMFIDPSLVLETQPSHAHLFIT